MSEPVSILQLEVVAGSDVLRHERLTRDLCDDLSTLSGVNVSFEAAAAPSGEGRKGTMATVLTLIATITTMGRPAAQVLIAAIQEWCARDGRRIVRIKDGDRTLEIIGNPTGAQQSAIEEFIHRLDDHGESSAQ